MYDLQKSVSLQLCYVSTPDDMTTSPTTRLQEYLGSVAFDTTKDRSEVTLFPEPIIGMTLHLRQYSFSARLVT